MKLGRDLIASIGSSLGTLVVTLVAVPFFIYYVGPEGFGVIGLATAMQGLLLFLDLGLTPTISRQVARELDSGDRSGSRTLLRTMTRIYWIVAILIAAVIALLAPAIATGWLNPGALDPHTLGTAVMLIGLQLACRWPGGLYLGALVGARHVVAASVIGLAFAIAANLGGVAILAFYAPSLAALFAWQAAAALLYTLALRHYAWRALGGADHARFDVGALRSVWRFAAGMSGVAVVSVLTSQIDKAVLSKLISLESFGYYMLAILVASALYRITAPIFNVIYPRFSQLVGGGRYDELRSLYRTISSGFAIVWFPGVMALTVLAEPLLVLWTANPDVAERTALLLSLIAVGTGLHGMMWFPYALLLAYGATRLTLGLHLALLAVEVPMILVLAGYYGAVGGAAAWLLIYAFYMLLGTIFIYRRILPGVRKPWIVEDVGRPLVISILIGIGLHFALAAADLPGIAEIAVGAIAAALAMLISARLSPYRLRDYRAALGD